MDLEGFRQEANNMKLKKRYSKDMKRCTLRSDKFKATVSRSYIFLSQKDERGEWQPLEDRQVSSTQGLTANVAEAEKLLELQAEADKARQDRIKVLQDGMSTDSVIADPVGTLSAARELETLGAAVQVEAPPKNPSDGSFDSMLRNPSFAVSEARRKENQQ